MNSIFSMRNASLNYLDESSAVSFFRDLLFAESNRLGIPHAKVNISMKTKIADGGIDASVEQNETSETRSGLISAKGNSYQIKAGSSFKPWNDSAIKKELFGSKPVCKSNLGKMVENCLDNAMSYVLVCFGRDFTCEQREKAKRFIVSSFEECDYQDPKVEVWGHTQLIGFTNMFPSLVLSLQGIGNYGFQTYKSWSRQEDMNKKYELGKEQQAIIDSIQVKLRSNTEVIHIRLCGEPGVGKTRLVLEAVSAEDLKPLVVYFETADNFKNSNLISEILEEHERCTVILVIDECDTNNSVSIWNKLKSCGPRVKLISICNENDEGSGDTKYIDIPLLDDEQIGVIIEQYDIPKDQVYKWAHFCSGSPRVAHVIGWNLKNNPDDLLRSPDTVNVWERYIVGGDDPTSSTVESRTVVLQYVSLYKKFGFKKPVEDEAKYIVAMIREHDPHFTFPKFQKIVNELQNKKILQGDTTLYITPKLLHIWLWKGWWETYGSSFDIDKLLKTELAGLQIWFYDMFVYAAESKTAVEFVENLLINHRLFSDNNFIRTRQGSELILKLSGACPRATLGSLKKIIGGLNKKQLYELKECRQNFVWALEKIAVWKGYFTGAATLLLSLAETENDNYYSNNSSGAFVDLFPIYAYTEATFVERFNILKEAMNSGQKEKQLLAIRGCEKFLDCFCMRQVIFLPDHEQGLKSIKPWVPRDRTEEKDCIVKVWDLLQASLKTLADDEGNKALNVLLQKAEALIRMPDIADRVLLFINNIVQKNSVSKQLIIEKLDWIISHVTPLSENIITELRAIFDNLLGNDFSSLMKRYITMELSEDRSNDGVVILDKREGPIRKLVQQVLIKPELLQPELPWLVMQEAKMGYRFGYELGKQDTKLIMLDELLNAQRSVADSPDASDFVIGGYLKAIFERDLGKWEEVMDDISKDHKLAKWITYFTWRSGMTHKAALRILILAKSGVLKAQNFAAFSIGDIILDLSEDRLQDWLEYLLNSSEDYAAHIALMLHHRYYIAKKTQNILPEKLTLQLLAHQSLYAKPSKNKSGGMTFFYWGEIVKAFIKLHPKSSLILADTILKYFGENDGILQKYSSNNVYEVMRALIQQDPENVWKYVTQYLKFPINQRAKNIGEWLGGGSYGKESLSLFLPKDVWQWVDFKVDERAPYLARTVSAVLFKEKGRICWGRELLKRYGDRADVQENLKSNFGTESWRGKPSKHYQTKKENLLAFKKNEDDLNVNTWIDSYVIELDAQVKEEKIREEREW